MEFSDLALAKLLQTAPELGSLILTFQDLSEEVPPESGMQAGVFVMKSGTELFYAPVLSRNGSLYPIDSLFLESTGRFVPLSRKVIEGVVNSGQIEKGKATKIPNTVNGNPSIQNLVNPPRTGKFVYASSSRLLDFLAGTPEQVRGWVFEKIAAEKSVYDNLDKMFSLKALFDVLKPSPIGAASKGAETSISIVTAANPTLAPDQIQSILSDGYAVVGTQPAKRMAISVQDFERDGVSTKVSSLDGDKDYDLAFNNGSAREAFLPKMHKFAGSMQIAVFSNCDFATSFDGFVSVGAPLERTEVLDRMFQYQPPVLLRDVFRDDFFAIMTNSGAFIGPLTASRVEQSNLGVELHGISGGGCATEIRSICAYRNFKGEAEVMDNTLFVPYNSIVIRLNKNVSLDLERSPLAASRRREIETLRLLGDEINLGFDGVEFAMNGLAIGGIPSVMDALVVKEGIDPDQARTFVKQAQQNKFVKIYLTKAASTDYNPASTPQYGSVPPDDANLVGPQGAFMPAISQAVETGDSQTVEASIISQLLQVPDLHEQIEEYLPDIEEAVDKLGRILFLSRLHIAKLSETQGPDEVFSLLAQLKAVYRMLGENLVKLKQIIEAGRGDVTSMEG